MRAKLFVQPTSEDTRKQISLSKSVSPNSNSTGNTSGTLGNTSTEKSPTTASVNLTILSGAFIQRNPAFDPNPLTIKKGDVIKVNNMDSAPHTVTNGKGPDDPDSGKLFDTGVFDAGDSAEISTTDIKPGGYPFYCAVHPYMTGSLRVCKSILTTVC